MCHVFYVSYFRFGSYVSLREGRSAEKSSLPLPSRIYVVARFPSVPDCLCYPCVMFLPVPPCSSLTPVCDRVRYRWLLRFVFCFSAAAPVCDLLPPPGSKRLFPGFWYLGFVLLLHLLLGPFTLCQLCGKSPAAAAAAAAKMAKKKQNAFSGQNNCNQTAHSRLLSCVMCSWSNEFNFFFHNFCHFRSGHQTGLEGL